MERSAWPKNLSSSRKSAIQELLDGQNPTKKIKHLFDAHSQTGNNTAQPSISGDLIVDVLRSFSNTPSLSCSAAESYEVLQVPSNACVKSEVSEGSESIHTPVPRWCRKCGKEEASVLLLPCRHLCLCAVCESSLHTCPLCNCPKSASVQINPS